MANNWNLKVVRVNFSAIRGDFENQIEEQVQKYVKAIDGELKDVIYTNPGDIQKAIIFITYSGTMKIDVPKAAPTEPGKTVEQVDKGGVKAEIVKEA
jgi:hypothetical protein